MSGSADSTEPVHGVVFDFDGVLVESSEAYRQALSEAVAPVARGDWPKLYGMTTAEAVVYAAGGTLPDARVEEISVEIDRRVGELLSRTPPARPGAEEAVLKLKHAGLRLGVASSAARCAIDGTLAALGWDRHFAVVVGREDASRTKPFPDIYREAVRRLQIEAARTWAIEDTDIGVRAARGAGLFTVALGGTQSAAELQAADLYCDDYDALKQTTAWKRLFERSS